MHMQKHTMVITIAEVNIDYVTGKLRYLRELDGQHLAVLIVKQLVIYYSSNTEPWPAKLQYT
jgi:hypothetical protein